MKTRKIVIADFDPQGVELMRTVLASRGHKVASTRDGQEAMRLIESEAPDLVVLSGVLPGRTGFSVCREVSARGGKAPGVVIVLDVDDTFTRGLAQACGAREILIKPVDPEQLAFLAERRIKRPDVAAMLEDRSGTAADAMSTDDFPLKSSEETFLEPFVDAETGVFNRTYLMVRLMEEYKKTRRYGSPLVAVVLEMVARGEENGLEDAMAQAASVLLLESRDTDVVGRLDAARFLLLLTHTGVPGARTMLRRVHATLRRVLPDGPRCHAGLSLAPHPDHAGPDDFLQAAEAAARSAVRTGAETVGGED